MAVTGAPASSCSTANTTRPTPNQVAGPREAHGRHRDNITAMPPARCRSPHHRRIAMRLLLFSAFITIASLSVARAASPAPVDCAWEAPTPGEPGPAVAAAAGQDEEEARLSCLLRPATDGDGEGFDANFTSISSERTSSLHLACEPGAEVVLAVALREKTLSHVGAHLRDLSIDGCRLSEWPASALTGMRRLRSLSVQAWKPATQPEPSSFDGADAEEDWPSDGLRVAPGSFEGAPQLERLDMSGNAIRTFPRGLFCPLTNLVTLNVSHNRLRDIGELDFRETESNSRPAAGVNASAAAQGVPCSLDVQSLDVSWNRLAALPARGLAFLRRLKDLDLSHNMLQSVSPRSLSGLKALAVLDLSGNRLGPALSPRLFRDSSDSLRELRLRDNALVSLEPGLLSGLARLTSLDVSRNRIGRLHPASLTGLIRLVALDLSHNYITVLGMESMSPNEAIFRDLYTLQILDLSYNRLESLPPGIFAPCSNLHTLILSQNKLTRIDARALNGLFVLSLLSLDNNQIQRLDPESLTNCTALQDLNLNGNQLKEVPMAVRGLRLLRTLDLGDNVIETLVEDGKNSSESYPPLSGLPNLYGLRLIGNHITTLTRKSFSSLPALQILNLARNKISVIEKGTFDSNTALQAIRLDANLVTDLTGLFSGLPSLLWLNVSDNRISDRLDLVESMPPTLQWLDVHANAITEIGCGRKIGELEEEAVKPDLQLQTLDASFNRLTRVGGTAGTLPDSLRLLFLNDNFITAIEPHIFLDKINLTRVDLYANRIVTMELAALRLTPVSPDQSLPEFYIGGNPFRCDCSMEWLQVINNMTSSLRQYPKVADLDAVYCRLVLPRRRRPHPPPFVPILQASPSDFLCPYKTHCFALCHCCDFDACDCEMTCPNNCTCYHDHAWSTNVVDCSSAGYTSTLPVRIPMDATEVYLDGNALGALPSHAFIGRKNLRVLLVNSSSLAGIRNHTFSGLGRLSVLHLQDNHLRELRGFEFRDLEALKELYLQGNRLRYIDERTFSHLRNLEVLRLDGNRLSDFAVWRLGGVSNPLLTHVSLSGNRWPCADCRHLGMLHEWVRKNIRRVSDARRITCVYFSPEEDGDEGAVGPPLAALDAASADEFGADFFDNSSAIVGVVSTICSPLSAHDNTNLGGSLEKKLLGEHLPFLLAAVIALPCALIVTLLGVCYRRELRAWMHSRCGVRVCYRRDASSSSSSNVGMGCDGNIGVAIAGDDDESEGCGGDDSTLEAHMGKLGGRKRGGAGRFLFDAYICHSARDDAFVRGVLAAGLEARDPRYRIGLHYRDLPSLAISSIGGVGGGNGGGGGTNGGGIQMPPTSPSENSPSPLADAVVEAVERSRRTILVLSAAFISGEWRRFEVRSALAEALRGGSGEKRRRRQQRLIVVLLGELPRELDPDLRLHLKGSAAVLRWGDSLFWEKLRYALPDVHRQPLPPPHGPTAVTVSIPRKGGVEEMSVGGGNIYASPDTVPPPSRPLPLYLQPHRNGGMQGQPQRELPRIPQPMWA
ncbi:toll-like receptor Tollo [Ischnura elegans]|uniref:toll-like receptor Tollo n=1 Tax=Ischnura elegans TaxID=197161 RepID=UPI001ED87E8E|nr:toll-like receptor Tollo [Ischnura elegans]